VVSVPRPLRGGRGRQEAVRAALSNGGAVGVRCKLRRTSARGWGAWTDARVELGASPGGAARWQVQDPIAVGFAITKGAIDLPFEEVNDVWLRAVRFQTEAFFGLDAEIVVVASDRGTIELAVGRDYAAPLARRLAASFLDQTNGQG
jgi:hypothetical protein